MRIVTLLVALSLASACSAKDPALVPNPRIEWAGPGEVTKYMGSDATSPKMLRHHGGVLVVRLTSSTRIVEYLKKNDYTLSVDSYLCDKPDKEVLLTPFGMYYRGISLAEAPEIDPTQQDAPPYTYDLIILDSADGGEEVPLSWRGGRKPRRYQPFDLRSSPEDVCLRVVAGGIAGGYRDYESALIRVRRSQIEEAIKRRSAKR